MLTDQDKEHLKRFLKESAEKTDNAQIAMVMINGESMWFGSPFELLGWTEFIHDTIKERLGPKKSPIVLATQGPPSVQ